MAKIVFTKAAVTFTFETARSYPADDPVQVNVVTGYSEGRRLYAYDKGIEEQFFNLTFKNATQNDFDNFESFMTDTVVGPKETFTFTDENETEHTVRLMDTRNPLKKVGPGKYSGTISLRKEI